ncbi:MAG: DUF1003 domain-containing protein [Leptospirales bacterium]|nr:DUF1003 domain-containing protein [Leptospirales bacterium]
MNQAVCEICKGRFPESHLISEHAMRHEIEALIQKNCPTWKSASRICKKDFDAFRTRYLVDIIEEEKGSIEVLEQAVIDNIKANEIITLNTNRSREPVTFGERVADAVAAFGGSWKFIIAFFSLLILWIFGNSLYLIFRPFDPYPFILLNLILSCLAAIQAPIIMMSQNRQETKDRLRSENDYKINLKSEIEIRTLHEKVDHLLLNQWSKMVKIQEIQIEILEEIRTRLDRS